MVLVWFGCSLCARFVSRVTREIRCRTAKHYFFCRLKLHLHAAEPCHIPIGRCLHAGVETVCGQRQTLGSYLAYRIRATNNRGVPPPFWWCKRAVCATLRDATRDVPINCLEKIGGEHDETSPISSSIPRVFDGRKYEILQAAHGGQMIARSLRYMCSAQ